MPHKSHSNSRHESHSYSHEDREKERVVLKGKDREREGSSSRLTHRHRDSVSSRRHIRPLPRHERYTYTYRLVANNTPLEFMIAVESESGRPIPGNYTFRLSFKANSVERILGEPATMKLSVDPRKLEFVVFIFPGKSGAPTGSLWSVRVWLRVNFVDHRLFGDDDLWVAKDPDFNSIGDASFARLKSSDQSEQVYNAYVGRALVTFIIRWKLLSNKTYAYSLEYEANGVGDVLFEDLRLRLDIDPRAISFLIYTTASNAIPLGASHKLRIWLRSLVPLPSTDPATSYALPFNDSYIYQRIFKLDGWKIGGRLDFDSLGAKMVKGFSAGPPVVTVVAGPGLGGPGGGVGDLWSQSSGTGGGNGNGQVSVYREKRGYNFSDTVM